MIEALEINHVCLFVPSLSEAQEYYEKVFNFRCSIRDTDHGTMMVESPQVHFFFSEYKNEKECLSKQHISFTVNSIDEVIIKLEKLGVVEYTIGESDCFKHNNYKWCEWRDPSGIRLECVEIL